MNDALFTLFRSDIAKLDSLTQRNLFFSFRELVFRNLYFILNDWSLTEDAVQESFIKAMKKGPRIQYDSNIKAWLKQVARNTAYDMIRKNKKYCHVSDFDTVMTNDENEPHAVELTDEYVEKMLRNEALTEALNELQHEFRVVLVLRYMEEMSYKEISNEVGISEQTAAKRVERAKKKLTNIFISKWGD
ncbi:MAG: subfamily polymerase sigma-24 factor [Paenibacillaceae bacterium]|nr:subfamily polymerase sigma-24 factor [Paenibacillaceae bacterium]